LPSRCTFSLGILFRSVTLLCLVLGWLALVRFSPPTAVQTVLIAIVGVMAVIVAFRRGASPLGRMVATCWFFGLGLLVATYSALWAWIVQLPVDDAAGRWAGLDQTIFAIVLVFAVPPVVAALIFMARTWMWSAYDRQLHK
jgi:hypothetical protein